MMSIDNPTPRYLQAITPRQRSQMTSPHHRPQCG